MSVDLNLFGQCMNVCDDPVTRMHDEGLSDQVSLISSVECVSSRCILSKWRMSKIHQK